LTATWEGAVQRVGQRRWVIVALGAVLVLGGAFRMVGTNWDDGEHLHPDERFVTTVAANIHWPAGPLEYFDVEHSSLSPYNSTTGTGYLYGLLPLFGTKLVASATSDDEYGSLNLVGRRLSALLDTGTILLVFAIALLLLREARRPYALQGAVLAAALYSVTVTAIQHAHFFTVDSWLTFLGCTTFLLAMVALRRGVGPGSKAASPIVLLTGVSLGATVACKVSGALVLVPLAVALAGRVALVARWAGARKTALRAGADSAAALMAAYVTFRIVSPYAFAHSSWLDLSVNHDLRTALDNQARASSGSNLYPPSYQWLLSARVWAPLENLVVWQLGIPLAVAALTGLALASARVARGAFAWRRERAVDDDAIVVHTYETMLVAFVLTVFFWFGTSFVHSGRYLVPIAPFLAVAAAVAVAACARRRTLWWALAIVIALPTTAWAGAFTHVYTQPNTRVAATAWIKSHVPTGSTIADEHWDDPLPLRAAWIDPNNEYGPKIGYVGVLLPVFDADDANKLRTLYDGLSSADYYVLSSPRAWRTIGRLPDRFPLMARYYNALFAGRLGYREVASFTTRPELFGVHVDDLRAEEAFWVYDHPPVHIFRRTRPLTWAAFRDVLCRPPTPAYCR
jgi:hypothetical protein